MPTDPAQPAPSSLASRLWPKGFAATMRPRIRFSAMGAIAVMLFGALWPDDLHKKESWFVAISWAAFMVRTFWFHAGIALILDAAMAWWVRARLTALALLLVGMIAVFPAILSLAPKGREPAPGEPTFTVMSVNLLYGSADAQQLARAVESVRPDVILFQEYTPDSAARLTQALGDSFPHRVQLARDDAFGQAIYSRTPFTDEARPYPPGPGWTEPQFRAQVSFGDLPVTLMDVHVFPPTGMTYLAEQRAKTAALAELCAQETRPPTGAPAAFIIAGDFNATPESSHIALMLASGLRSAHALAGSGRGSTWPRDTFLRFAPGVRIDHVLFAGPLACIQSGVCNDIGSDHRPTYARFVRAAP